jgi:hypothetical protein
MEEMSVERRSSRSMEWTAAADTLGFFCGSWGWGAIQEVGASPTRVVWNA